MSKTGRWSTTAGNNNAATPDGWPEGQPPSTVNDCAREMMASIRTLINDAQYIDQDFTPTYISATTFSVPGNQTSAIHAGRRLKIYDATAGVATTIYATVVTASYTALTTIQVANDAGQLTTSLSSFAIAILSQTNDSLPRDLILSVSSIAAGSLSISGAAQLLGPVFMGGTVSISATAHVGALYVLSAAVVLTTLTVGGELIAKSNFSCGSTGNVSGNWSVGGTVVGNTGLVSNGTLSVSGTAVAVNIAKAWVRFTGNTGVSAPPVVTNMNVASVTRSSLGVFRINFTNAFADNSYSFTINAYPSSSSNNSIGINYDTVLAGSFKFRCKDTANASVDPVIVCATFYR